MRARRFDLNLLSVIAIGIGSIVGAGIFALLGEVILSAGDLTYYAFLIAGIIAMLCGYSYAKLAAVYPQSGGLTDYFYHAFPSKVISGGFSILYWLTSSVSVCMLAKSFGLYMLNLFHPVYDPTLFADFFAVVLIVTQAFLNMAGADDVGKAELLLVGIKVAILFILIVTAFAAFDGTIQTHPVTVTGGSFFKSIGITFFAYAGFGVITNAAADVARPQKTITHAIYLTLFIVMALYMSLAFVVLNFVPLKELMAGADTAVTAAAERLMGVWGYALLYLAAVIAFVSGVSATFFSTFRISQSLAHQGILPRFYAEKFWRHGSWGNLLSVVLIMAATVSFDFNAIVNLSSGAFLVSYLAIFIANWVLREKTKPSAVLTWGGFILLSGVFIGFIYGLS